MKQSKINLKNVKKSNICKNVKSNFINRQIKKTHKSSAGDVAVFKIVSIGKHTRIESPDERNIHILQGDLIMAAFGNRYATAQIEGYVPDTYQKTYHILGQGGAVGIVKSFNEKFIRVGPTSLKLIGYMVDDEGKVINTKDIATKPVIRCLRTEKTNAKIILSLGTSMDSGKTTSAAFLARGLKLADKKVAYFKLTGTVYSKDKNMVLDHGAQIVCDFSDLGFPSTYMCSNDELMDLYKRLFERVNSISPDYIIVEIADGLLQRETYALINNEKFMKNIFGVLFSSGDSISAISGADMLSRLGCNVVGVTGLFTISPLLVEEAKAKSDFTILQGEDLKSKEIINIFDQHTKYTSFEEKVALIG